MKDFFISYNRHDKQWAEWIAWTLEEAGYTVVIQAWDFRPGGNFALDMNRAVTETQTTIAVLSETFLKSDYTAPEWAAAFARDPKSIGRKLIPVRVEACEPEGLLAQIVYVDLVGVAAPSIAKDLVLGALQERAKPAQEPRFPGVVVPKAERTASEPVGFPGEDSPTPETGLTLSTFEFAVLTYNTQGQANRRQAQAQYFVEDLGNGIGLKMVSIPGGSFLMGAPESEAEREETEGPQHRVTIKPFFMGKYPVTQAQWQAVAVLPKVKLDLRTTPSWCLGDDRPVEWVNWHEAVEFCGRLSISTGRTYRLPSEAEWEYACRSGTTTPFHFGETITAELVRCNSWGSNVFGAIVSMVIAFTKKTSTSTVGSFPPNAFGLYDLHGNVYEWCLDQWHNSYEGAPTDGSAWVEGGNPDRRVLRGGSFYNSPRDCRSAFRFNPFPSLRYDYIGFRVVCSAQ